MKKRVVVVVVQILVQMDDDEWRKERKEFLCSQLPKGNNNRIVAAFWLSAGEEWELWNGLNVWMTKRCEMRFAIVFRFF